MTETTNLEITEDFLEKIKAFKKDFRKKYKDISREETPQVDGTGKRIIEKRPDGYDYIIESYMRESLDKHFPGWSLEMAAPLHFLGVDWIVAQVILIIIDEYLLPFGINPPTRRFYGTDAVRVQYRKGLSHTPDNIVDVGDNAKQAVTAAMKYAINRLTHIGDDVYGKRIEEEGAGSLEEVVMATGDAIAFGQWVQGKRIAWSEVFAILGIKSLAEVTDFKEAMEKIKKTKELK